VLVSTQVRVEVGSLIQRYTSINLSSGGVYLECETPLPIGSRVRLRFTLPGAGQVEAQGTVRHHRPFFVKEGKNERTLRGMGIAFERVEGDGAQALADQIKILTLKSG
jgi:uncharacterized protein (TIGR02266 family)